MDIDNNMHMKVWAMPSMRLMCSVPLRDEPTAIDFSPTLPVCALGYSDGQIRLIEIVGNQPKEITNPHTLEQHIGAVCALSFCDDLKVYCSSSLDGQLKVWDLGNR